MLNNYTALFNQADEFKNNHPEMDDITLFFEFHTFELLENYDATDRPFILKHLLKKFSCDEESVCAVILYDILQTQILSKKQWDSIINALKQAWAAKQAKPTP